MDAQTELFNKKTQSGTDVSISIQDLFSDALANTLSIQETAKHNKAVKSLIAYKMEVIRKGNKRSGSGIATTRYIAEMVDTLIRALWDKLEINSDPHDKLIALVAVGGYGRLEMFPRSDIDLLILTSDRIYPEEIEMSESIIRSLWDYGFEVGSSVRSIKQCEEAIQSDMETWTSFLNERFLGGNHKLYKKFLKLVNKQHRPWKITEFINHKLQERNDRIKKFGGLIQLLEPNLKEGAGCLREVHTVMWTARLKYGCRSFEDLIREGLLSPTDLEEMRAGYEFLMRARCSLHFITAKKDDLLAFHLQPDVALEFGFNESEKTQSVELFLQTFYRHTKSINRITEAFLSRWKKIPQKKRNLSILAKNEYFKHEKGTIEMISKTGNPFKNNISLVLEYFNLANIAHLAFGNFSLNRIRQAIKTIDPEFANPKDYVFDFLALCKRPERVGRMLRGMHEVGLIELIIPDFKLVNCHTQHNIYHIYTTDEHTISVVRQLAYLKENKDPILNTCRDALTHVGNMDVLILACIFHDIGKGIPGDHSLTGAKMVFDYMMSAGFTKEQSDEARILVIHHLAMNEIAQRRNLDDPKIIHDFIKKIRSPATLHKLYVLTYCDASSVHPDAWSDWKSTLLKNLYYKALMEMEQPDYRKEYFKGNEIKLIQKLKGEFPAEDIKNHFAGLPKSYSELIDETSLRVHLNLVNQVKKNQVVCDIKKSYGPQMLVVTAVNKKNLLSAITASLDNLNLSIVSANIYTRKDSIAIDEFLLTNHDKTRLELKSIYRQIERDIQENLKLDSASLYKKQRERKEKKKYLPANSIDSVYSSDTIHIEQGIKFSNTVSGEFSTIDISCKDQKGLMFLVSNIFSKLEIQVHGAVLSTEAQVAMDSFYVTDMKNRKIVDQNRISIIKEKLREVLIGKP